VPTVRDHAPTVPSLGHAETNNVNWHEPATLLIPEATSISHLIIKYLLSVGLITSI
jgi:hypothetical protein